MDTALSFPKSNTTDQGDGRFVNNPDHNIPRVRRARLGNRRVGALKVFVFCLAAGVCLFLGLISALPLLDLVFRKMR